MVMEQIESERRNFEAKLAEVEKRCKIVPAKLPIAKTWRQESVTYEGEVVAYGGSAYQAARTGLASRAGNDGRSPTARQDCLDRAVRGGTKASAANPAR